jgi:hypothetical protein
MDDELKQLAFRVPTSMLKQIDAYAAYMREQNPGLGATRTDAVRVLLAQALAAFEKAQTRPKRK